MLRIAKPFRYEGEYNEYNQRHGIGRSFLRNGDTYVGSYYNGNRYGFGIYTCSNGATYEGEWVNGKKHGLGKFTYPDGSVYDGAWKKDLRHGYGIYRYPNNDIYDGKWVENMKCGLGKYYYSEAQVQYSGTWTMGERDEGGDLIDTDLESYLLRLKLAEIERNKIRNNIQRTWNLPYFEPVKLPAYGKPFYPGGEGVIELSNRRSWWMTFAMQANAPPPYPGHEGLTELANRRAWWDFTSIYC